MRKCPYCNKRFEEGYKYWYNKYLCYECYHNRNTKYKIGDYVYTDDNIKDNKTKTLNAVTSLGKVINIYSMNRPTLISGLYQYAIRIEDRNKTVFRYLHRVFSTKEECDKFIEATNRKRDLNRNARAIIKELNEGE